MVVVLKEIFGLGGAGVVVVVVEELVKENPPPLKRLEEEEEVPSVLGFARRRALTTLRCFCCVGSARVKFPGSPDSSLSKASSSWGRSWRFSPWRLGIGWGVDWRGFRFNRFL